GRGYASMARAIILGKGRLDATSGRRAEQVHQVVRRLLEMHAGLVGEPFEPAPHHAARELDRPGRGPWRELDAHGGAARKVLARRTGRTSKVLGEFTVEGVAGGTQALTLRRGSLPPYYVPPAAVSIGVPTSQPVLVPVTLPIGSNRPNVYMGFGDSITIGQGS